MAHKEPTTRKSKQIARSSRRWANDFGMINRALFCVFVIGALVAGGGGWAATAELAGAVISHGTVVADGRVKKVQHRDGGIVSAVHVKNGDRVAEGQSLLKLDDTQTRAELGVVQSQLMELRVRQARLSAVRDQTDAVIFPKSLENQPGLDAMLNAETRLFNDERATRESQKEQLTLGVEQLENEAKGLSSQEEAKATELGLIEKELVGVRDLHAEKLTPVTRVYALEREQTRLAGEHGSLVAQGARVRGQISEKRLQILNLDQSAKTDAQKELRTVEARIAELTEREIAATDRLSRMDMRAPANGIVHQLQVNTIGGVITSAEPVLLIVPEGHSPSIEIRVSPGDIDQVHVGQEVRLRFSSFNQRTTPEVMGHVSYVSADIVPDPKQRADYYTALVQLEDPTMTSIGDKAILPGMPVDAFVVTTKRTAWSYFTKPITDQFQRALTEE